MVSCLRFWILQHYISYLFFFQTIFGLVPLLQVLTVIFLRHNSTIMCLITDIDECALQTASCQHICTDRTPVFNDTTSLKYECSCRSGFNIQPDNSCQISKFTKDRKIEPKRFNLGDKNEMIISYTIGLSEAYCHVMFEVETIIYNHFFKILLVLPLIRLLWPLTHRPQLY